MDLEFRYDFGKVLGTQNHSTYGLASSHCVLHLNLIKGMFNIVFYTHTHTHTNMHLKINMASNILKPNIHLSCLSTKPSIHLSWRLIQGNNKSRQQVCMAEHVHTHNQIYTQCMFMWMHDLPPLSYYILAPMHHKWTYECMFMASK